MILRVSPDEEIQRYITVINSNDVSVDIDLTVSGDLASSLDLEETSFSLEPNTEKRAYFTIFSDLSGTYETNINVAFSQEEGNGVGLSATIILIISDGNSSDQDQTPFQTSDSDNDMEPISNPDSNFSFNPGQNPVPQQSNSSISSTTILLISTAFLVIVLIVSAIILLKPKNKSRRKNA
ncbi:hypothetical protein CMI47_17630 [Candidatus Pacearchaeota archaeon]|nr:hypothetical protein [Candidatus Pacearchaeota archaeon]|tara:strand:+ start:8553 stop:9092 length:540 start_codon:yes stop_codon:yes gene_type:complete